MTLCYCWSLNQSQILVHGYAAEYFLNSSDGIHVASSGTSPPPDHVLSEVFSNFFKLSGFLSRSIQTVL